MGGLGMNIVGEIRFKTLLFLFDPNGQHTSRGSRRRGGNAYALNDGGVGDHDGGVGMHMLPTTAGWGYQKNHHFI